MGVVRQGTGASAPPYRVVSTDDWVPEDEEPLGSKKKRWFRGPDERLWLFKEVRGLDRAEGPEGEDWSEKIAAELAATLELPCARVELASYRGRRGIVSLAVLEEDDTLVHGDLLLNELDPSYDRGQHRVAEGMTVTTVWQALHVVHCAKGSRRAMCELGARANMAEYLVFDALIGNTDRHHSNWGIIRHEGRPDRMAPSFDHASSLGFNVRPAKLDRQLENTVFQDVVRRYAGKGRGKFQGAPGLVDLAREAAFAVPDTVKEDVVARIESLGPSLWTPILERVPEHLMSHRARMFAAELLQTNRERLLHDLAD